MLDAWDTFEKGNADSVYTLLALFSVMHWYWEFAKNWPCVASSHEYSGVM